MLDAKRLLDSLLQAGMTDSAPQRIRHALGPDGLGGQQGGGLLGHLAGMLGGQAPSAGQAGGGLGGIVGQVLGGLQQSVGRAGEGIKSNDPLTVGGLGAIAGALLGGRKGAVGGGALALLGSLALAALQASGRAPAAGAQPAVDRLADQLGSEDTALLLVRAMVAAAKADGRIDQQEIARITGKLEEIGADEETRQFVAEELRRPLDLDSIVRAVPGPEVAVEVYAASLLAIEVDTPAERAYLEALAGRLQLPAPVVAQVHRALGVA